MLFAFSIEHCWTLFILGGLWMDAILFFFGTLVDTDSLQEGYRWMLLLFLLEHCWTLFIPGGLWMDAVFFVSEHCWTLLIPVPNPIPLKQSNHKVERKVFIKHSTSLCTVLLAIWQTLCPRG